MGLGAICHLGRQGSSPEEIFESFQTIKSDVVKSDVVKGSHHKDAEQTKHGYGGFWGWPGAHSPVLQGANPGLRPCFNRDP